MGNSYRAQMFTVSLHISGAVLDAGDKEESIITQESSLGAGTEGWS